MKILVCISSVPDTTTKISFTNDNKSFNTEGVQFVINPYDEFGLTRALQLKEKNGGSVTVIHVGPATNDPVIRKALAIGADDAIRINAEPKDAMMVAREIAKVVEADSYDLIITGRESIDYNSGQVPGLLGAMLSIPTVSPCVKLEIEGGQAQAERIIDGGKEVVEASLPMIVGGQKGLVSEEELRIPNMRGIMQARSKKLDVKEASGAANTAEVSQYELPAEKAACKYVDPSNVKELVELLHSEAKVI